jgi:two-component system, NtrC family, sensor kinase
MNDWMKRLLARFRNVRLAFRIGIMMALILVGTAYVFASYSIGNLQRYAYETSATNVIRLGQAVESILRFSMLENRRDEIKRAIVNLANHEDIESVTLADHSTKTIIFAADDSEQGKTIENTDARCTGCHADADIPRLVLPKSEVHHITSDNEVINTVTPIYNSQDCYHAACHAHSPEEQVLGVMQIGLTFGPVLDEFERARHRLLAMIFLLALVTATLVFWLIQVWVGKPVKDLLAATEALASGDMDHFVKTGETELGKLGEAFNSMQRKLRETQRQIIMQEKLVSVGKLAAGVAHEINNPLTGILTFTEDLIDDAEEGDERLDDYEVIRRETLRCRGIVRNLLDFSKQDQPQLQDVNISDIIENTIKLVEKLAKFQNINLYFDPAIHQPSVVADPGQMEQVFLNFLINSSEAMDNGGDIRISSRWHKSEGTVELCFTDTGNGMSPQVLSKIFEPFFSTKGGKTSGLGLAVVWSIIERHGGRIEVQSEVDKGTTFRVFLPAEKKARKG